MSWPIVYLCDVARVVGGYAFKSKEFIAGGYPIVRISNITGSKVELKSAATVPESSVQDKERFLIESGDILIAMSGATTGKLGIVPEGIDKVYLNQRVGRFVNDKCKLDRNYLYYFLLSSECQTQINNLAAGAAQPNISGGQLESIKIPLPPLAVQKQIAAVLEKADTLRNQCQEMEQELNSLAQSVFLDMFGDPVRNEKCWKKCKLKEIVADFQGGKSIAASEHEENSGINRVLKISAVTTGDFKPNESKPLPNSYEPPREHFVKVNDLLFSRANTTELVGATSLVFETPENVLLPDKLWRFVWKDDTAQSQLFMWQLLSSLSMRKELGKISTGSGGSMKNISKAKLYDLEVIFPEKSKQLEFEAKYKSIKSLFSKNTELKIRSTENFDSLMQRAFKGELVLKDVA